MDRLKRTQSVQYYGQLASKSVEKQADAAKVEDVAATGDRKVSIPLSLVPEDALETHSVATAVPKSTTVSPPRCCLELTVRNAANLNEDEIVQLLQFEGKFDASRLGIILLLPDGDQIAAQLVNGMSGNCLLKAIGRNNVSANNFVYVFFPEEYVAKEGEIDIGEVSTKELFSNSIREVFLQSSQKGEFNELIGIMNQMAMDIYIDKDQRNRFEDQLQKTVDLIVGKLPSPNAENQEFWDNLHKAIVDVINENGDGDGEEKRARAREKLPVLDL
jgi:hypothetical protein